jgi:hypothetical protein
MLALNGSNIMSLFRAGPAADMNSWVQYSIGMAGVCVVVTGWVVYLESNHEHSHHADERAFKKVCIAI